MNISKNFSLLLVSALFLLSPAWAADELTLADIKAQNAQLLTKAELEQLLPGATNRSETQRAVRSWKHAADGKLDANSRIKPGQARSGGGQGAGSFASGTWRVNEEGQYCVEIIWPHSNDEKWCRHVYRVGDHYYGVGGGKDEAKAHKFTLSK